jgi:hypothetical protein
VAFTGFTSETRKISPGPGPDHLILISGDIEDDTLVEKARTMIEGPDS